LINILVLIEFDAWGSKKFGANLQKINKVEYNCYLADY
jgi:hypothetical protein